MLRTFPFALVLLLAGAVAVASAQQSTSHYGGGHSSRIGAISVYNSATKHYEPVTWDKQYTYFRLKVHLDQTFTDIFFPDPAKATLISIVASGDVYDNSTGAKVGTFDSSHLSTVIKANQEQQYLSTIAMELGPNGDDTFFVAAASDQLGPTPSDVDGAVTGGTGRYKGATGELFHSGPDRSGPETTYVIELAVPRFKRF